MFKLQIREPLCGGDSIVPNILKTPDNHFRTIQLDMVDAKVFVATGEFTVRNCALNFQCSGIDDFPSAGGHLTNNVRMIERSKSPGFRRPLLG